MQFDGVDEVQRNVRDEDGIEHGSEPDSDDCGPSARVPVALDAGEREEPHKTSESVAASSAAHPPTIRHKITPTTAVTIEATAVGSIRG